MRNKSSSLSLPHFYLGARGGEQIAWKPESALDLVTMAAQAQPPVISRGTKPSSHPLLSQLELIKGEEINKTNNSNNNNNRKIPQPKPANKYSENEPIFCRTYYFLQWILGCWRAEGLQRAFQVIESISGILGFTQSQLRIIPDDAICWRITISTDIHIIVSF